MNDSIMYNKHDIKLLGGNVMLAANYTTVRNKLKEYCDLVCDNKDTLIVTRKGERNVVILSLESYNEMERQIKNSEYMLKLARSREQLQNGQVVVKSFEELEALEK